MVTQRQPATGITIELGEIFESQPATGPMPSDPAQKVTYTGVSEVLLAAPRPVPGTSVLLDTWFRCDTCGVAFEAVRSTLSHLRKHSAKTELRRTRSRVEELTSASKRQFQTRSQGIRAGRAAAAQRRAALLADGRSPADVVDALVARLLQDVETLRDLAAVLRTATAPTVDPAELRRLREAEKRLRAIQRAAGAPVS